MAVRLSRQTTKRGVGIAAVLAALAIVLGAMVVLHAPFGRSLLRRVGGCPVGNASAADIEGVRQSAVAQMRGDGPAPARPSLGFTLDQTTRVDVLGWAAKHALACSAKREGLFLSCSDVPAAALGDRTADDGVVGEVIFAFRPGDERLVNLTAMSFGLPPAEGAARMERALGRLRHSLGSPTTAEGEVSADRLAAGGLSTSTASYRFRDYIAEVTATGFGPRGVALREHYVSATDGPPSGNTRPRTPAPAPASRQPN
jgi:hypothetical protein